MVISGHGMTRTTELVCNQQVIIFMKLCKSAVSHPVYNLLTNQSIDSHDNVHDVGALRLCCDEVLQRSLLREEVRGEEIQQH